MAKRTTTGAQLPPAAARSKRPAPARAMWAIGTLVVLAIGIIYGQTLGHTLLGYDDSGFVTDNPYVFRGITGEGIGWAITDGPYGDWFPLTMLSHMLDCQIFGLAPWGHHLVNVVLHVVALIGLFLLCRRMTGQLWPSGLVAALFAVHPQHVESVAWIAERRDMLSGLFFVLTLWAYLDYVGQRRPVGRYLLVAMLLALGLLSKPMLVTLPPLLLLLDYWPLRRFCGPVPENRGDAAPARATTVGVSPVAVSPAERMSPIWLVVEKLPLVALAAGTCLMTMRHGGAGKPHFDWSLRIGGAATSALAYLADLFYPANLVPFYCYPDGGFPLWKTAGSLALLAAVSVAAIVWRRRFPYALVGWFWYLGMLVPVLGLVTISGHVRADRYTYLPGIGLYLALALGGAQLAAHWPRRQWMLASCAAAGLAALVACSVRQAAIWRDDETLWRETLARDPHNAKAEFALATALASRGQTDEAIALYLRAERIRSTPLRFAIWGSSSSHEGRPKKRSGNIARRWRSSPTITRPTSISASHCSTGGTWPRRGCISKRPPESSRSVSKPAVAWPMSCWPKAKQTKPGPNSSGRWPSARAAPRPTPTWRPCCCGRET